MKILLIGSYPPPLGGVAVFIKRYKHRLESEGHTVDVLNPARLSNRTLLGRLLNAPARGYDLVSLNYPSVPVMLVLLARGLASRTEVFDHNWRRLETWNMFERRLYQLFLGSCRELILTAPHLKSYHREHGVRLPEQTRVQHAFLPPPMEDEAGILASYPADLCEFVRRRRPLVVANAFKLVFHEGVDLYGLDMCVRLVVELRKTYPDAGLLFALAEMGDGDYAGRMRREADAHGAGRNFYLMSGQLELWPLLKRADLFVRPTSTDGYAVSVAEALSFGCPVVASDVAERPDGTVLFSKRDDAEFQRQCLEVLAARVKVNHKRGGGA